jgi:spectinomycin phosphotransferase
MNGDANGRAATGEVGLMREPPDLADDAIVRALQTSFGLRVAALGFLPVGNDAASWAYRVQEAQGPSYFLKVRAGASPMPGAAVPSYLHRHGVPHVLGPLPTSTGAPYVLVDGFALALYPMLEASMGAEVGLSPPQWRQLGAALQQIHRVPLTPELGRMVGREAFRPTRRELVADLEALVATAAPDDPAAWKLAGCWRAWQDVIGALVRQADALGRHLARSSFPQVLCHADLHTWNVLVDPDQRLWLVDWDEAILAPRERDLMFVVGGGIGHELVRPRDTDCFFQGYGEARIDRRLLAYYRTAWAVQDIAAYGEEVLMAPRLGEESRRAAVDGFMDLFEPGNIVDLARASDEAGPPVA